MFMCGRWLRVGDTVVEPGGHFTGEVVAKTPRAVVVRWLNDEQLEASYKLGRMFEVVEDGQ